MKNADMPAQAVSSGNSINALDWQIANAIQWLEADNHSHVADDLRDARKKVAALVKALKEASESLGHMGAEHLKSRVDAALKAAGEEL